MIEIERPLTLQRIQQAADAAPVLQALRDDEVRRTNTGEAIVQLRDVFVGRPIDWQDVRMTVVRQGEAKLDWSHLLQYLTPLGELKGQPEILRQHRRHPRRSEPHHP